ncbi:MAG: hypothetical protein OHK0017_03800 [Patescibacteria group bacterium]
MSRRGLEPIDRISNFANNSNIVMSIKDRKLRQQQQLRNAILEATKSIAAEDGFEAITMRRIADEIEYSLPVIYKYFTNKEAIIAEIAKEGFLELQETLAKAGKSGKNYTEAAINMATAYVEYAIEKPSMYRAMFNQNGVINHDSEILKESEDAFDFIAAFFQDLKDRLGAKIDNVHDTTELVWSSFHGLASLVLINRINRGKVRYKELAERMILNFLQLWEI